ncbi:MAG: acyltransferase family protein [Rhodospirillales bacterium]|nr:acyltransferase family protein [Rhodospirillales bacterium]
MKGDQSVQPKSQRFHGLDSLRGIAALVVVFNHFYGVIPALASSENWLFSYTPLHTLIAGRQAVIIFFVLSGFVLSLPYVQGRAPPL